MALTQMGAGEKYSFRQFDTITDLYTGGLSVSTHMVIRKLFKHRFTHLQLENLTFYEQKLGNDSADLIHSNKLWRHFLTKLKREVFLGVKVQQEQQYQQQHLQQQQQ